MKLTSDGVWLGPFWASRHASWPLPQPEMNDNLMQCVYCKGGHTLRQSYFLRFDWIDDGSFLRVLIDQKVHVVVSEGGQEFHLHVWLFHKRRFPKAGVKQGCRDLRNRVNILDTAIHFCTLKCHSHYDYYNNKGLKGSLVSIRSADDFDHLMVQDD